MPPETQTNQNDQPAAEESKSVGAIEQPSDPLEAGAINPDDYSADELRVYLETGELPKKEAEVTVQDPAQDPAKVEEKPEDAPREEVKEPEKEAEPVPFKFTENADPETFAKEEAAFWEQYEKSPAIDAMLAHRDTRIAELETQINANPLLTDETASEHMNAFNQLVTFKLDPATNSHIPDTSGVISLLEKVYPQELPQVVEDLNSQPSPKYSGYTRLQQYIRDAFDLTPQAMGQLDYFFNNNGRLPTPSYVPEGIHPQLAEAYWSAEDRGELQAKIDAVYERVEAANFTLSKDSYASDEDKTDAARDKEAAMSDLRGINSRLNTVQKGIDADKERREFTQNQSQQAQKEIATDAETAFFQTSTGLLQQFSEKLSKAVNPLFDETGAGLTGLGYATLVEKALTDDDNNSKFAQAELTKHGISFDWKRGRSTLDQLWDTELLIAAQKKQNVNPRAIQVSLKQKDSIIKELQGLETELSGKIVAKVVTGNSNAIAKQQAVAAKSSAVKAKADGAPVSAPAKQNLMDKSLEELRAEVRRGNPYARAAQGDLSGFAG